MPARLCFIAVALQNQKFLPGGVEVSNTHATLGGTHVFYIDESGDVNRRGGPLFVLASVGIEHTVWDSLSNEIASLKKKYFPDMQREDVEIKGRYIAAGKGVFRLLSSKDRLDFVDDLMSIMEQYIAVIMCVVIDKPYYIARRNSADLVYEDAFEYLVERIHIYLDRRKADGFLVMDSRGASITGRKGPDVQIRKLYRIIKEQGTHFQTIHNVWEEPFFVESHYSVGIQLADVAAYSVYQVFSRKNPEHLWFKRLLGKLDINPFSKRIRGCGIKVFPDGGDLSKAIQEWEPRWLQYREGMKVSGEQIADDDDWYDVPF